MAIWYEGNRNKKENERQKDGGTASGMSATA